MKRVLVIDNFDSFTYNLVELLRVLGCELCVIRSDCGLPQLRTIISQQQTTHLLISPGPGHPRDAGVSEAVIRAFGGALPILGICLGMQAIVTVFGGQVGRAAVLMHGKSSIVQHEAKGLFLGLPQHMTVGRYHSLCALSLPAELSQIATSDGVCMGIRHRHQATYGLQFHPESILTPEGKLILQNFLVGADERFAAHTFTLEKTR